MIDAAPASSSGTRTRRASRRPRVDSVGSAACGPVVKWAGGKGNLLRELVRRMPPVYARYFEPFVGGAALFFRVAPARAVLGDTNGDLIELYCEIARDPRGLARSIARLARAHARDPRVTYYDRRQAWNHERGQWSPCERAATLVYLNKTCFNGLYRVNSSGSFNTPMGRQVGGPRFPDLARLVAAQSALRTVRLFCADYRRVFSKVRAGDFVYVDPPYPRGEGGGGFTSYTENKFDDRDHERLARDVRGLVRRGAYVMVSNADTPVTRQLYEGMQISSVMSPRSIGASVESRSPASEMIAVGGYVPRQGATA